MSTKHSRQTPAPSSPGNNGNSKLPKFLQKQNRDRSKSMTDPTAGSTTSLASSSSASSSSPPPPLPEQSKHKGKSSKLGGVKEREEGSSMPVSQTPSRSSSSSRPSQSQPQPQPQPQADTSVDSVDSMDEPPVIIEPPTAQRVRTRSERPISSVSDIHPSVSLYASNSSTSRISDLPTRLSGWFSHTFSTSSTDLSLPSLLSQQSHLAAGGQGGPGPGSPKGKGSALLTAAKHGKGHLDKAVRYLLDSDATPDKCTDPIWLLGVQHPGYEPPPPPSSSASSITPTPSGRRSSIDSLARRASSFRTSSSSQTAAAPELSQSQPSPTSKQQQHPGTHWPPVFYADFTSRIWLTYRSQFQPIRDSALSALETELAESQQQHDSTSPPPKRWNWPIGGEKAWTSDAGWGCMLRTGQSLLANALVHMHLGREWRRPPHPVHTADYAMYVQIITWFLDTPSPLAPFSVHRMALAGKELGKDVGQWFGPSTAAGAIKTLVHSFSDAALGVSVAADGVVYQNDVFAASHANGDPAVVGSPRRRPAGWGGRAVLVLVGIRLGLDGVNPVYYDAIKTLYTYPQSVGIAGGRPSSSYYFVGSQADNLFYLDPHHARPAVPLRPPPPLSNAPHRWERETTPENDTRRPPATTFHHRSPTSPSSSTRTGSSTFSYHAPLSPSPLQQQVSTSSSSSGGSYGSHGRWASASPSSELDHRDLAYGYPVELDTVQEHYVTAYSAMELKTFHCERVRKMPLSGLDPSMLIGFLCKDEADWSDFRKRIGELSLNHKTIFTIQDEPPHWPSDSDDNMGLESISEPDELDMDMPEDDEDQEEHDSEQFFETRSPSTSPDVHGKGQSSEVDTEEDPMGPITPGPNSRTTFDVEETRLPEKGDERADDFGDDDDDDWVDPSIPTPVAQVRSQPVPVPTPSKGKSNGSSSSKKGKKSKKSAIPMMKAPSPPTQQEQHFPFPVTHDSPPPSRQSSSPEPHSTSPEGKTVGKRMHMARARDGGRTQSGGVKGVLTAEDGDV